MSQYFNPGSNDRECESLYSDLRMNMHYTIRQIGSVGGMTGTVSANESRYHGLSGLQSLHRGNHGL
jgi:hypothetical protein